MGLTRRERYDRSEKGRARHRRYNQSPKGLARDARRQGTVKRELSRIRAAAKRRGQG